jgi:hypothetical protein
VGSTVKGNVSCQASISVKFNGILEFSVTFKIRGGGFDRSGTS